MEPSPGVRARWHHPVRGAARSHGSGGRSSPSELRKGSCSWRSAWRAGFAAWRQLPFAAVALKGLRSRRKQLARATVRDIGNGIPDLEHVDPEISRLGGLGVAEELVAVYY